MLLELDTMVAVGAVTPSTARVWTRSDRAGLHRLTLHGGGASFTGDVVVDNGADRTAAWTIPDEVPGAPSLLPETTYRFELAHAGGTIGTGQFTTAPVRGAARSFRFAAMSCHAPHDERGEVRERARQMLRAVHEALAERDVRFILAMGDQMYVDHPPALSMFDEHYFTMIAPPGRRSLLECSRDEVRTLYQQRYRQAWQISELRRLYADFPTWPMLDDHDVVDNFGSLREHSTPEWRALREGALDAFQDYQASRVFTRRPETFDHGFRWGGAAIYQLDIRTARSAEEGRTRVVAPSQLEALRGFLREHADARLLVVMLSVPIAYVPSWFATAAAKLAPSHGGTDRWSYAHALADRDRVLECLLAHAEANPHQQLVLQSGDIHVGSAFEIKWDGGPVFHQFTASAVTNEITPLRAAVYRLVPYTQRWLECKDRRAAVTAVATEGGEPGRNPFAGLNVGVVHVDDDGTQTRVRYELVTVSDDGKPETAYLSPWLGAPPSR